MFFASLVKPVRRRVANIKDLTWTKGNPAQERQLCKATGFPPTEKASVMKPQN